MALFKIYWDVGYGLNEEFEEFENFGEAEDYAYEKARDDFESQTSYGAEELIDNWEETDEE